MRLKVEDCIPIVPLTPLAQEALGSRATAESSEAIRWLWQVRARLNSFKAGLHHDPKARHVTRVRMADWLRDAWPGSDVRGGGLRRCRPAGLADSDGADLASRCFVLAALRQRQLSLKLRTALISAHGSQPKADSTPSCLPDGAVG